MAPQSTIETALSLPRPDPAALWLAQQEKQRGERRNSGVLIAVVALTALCVIGIGALVYFKLHNAAAHPVGTESQPSSSASAPPGPSAAVPSASATADAAPSAVVVAPPPTATAVATVAAAPVAAPTPASNGGNTAGATAAAAAAAAKDKPGKEDPGFLTIVCNPYCDDVLDQGRSLGPSPIVHLSVKPGQHRITLKKGTQQKVISVIIESGQVAAQRVSMK